MGLNGLLARLAVASPHVMVVEMPGGRGVRHAIEDFLDDRAWQSASSPGTAEVLVLAGDVTSSLAPYVDRVEAQLPGPRVRCQITREAAVERELDQVPSRLLDTAAQRQDASGRPDPRWVHRAEGEPAEPGHMAPEGIPLADGAQDRDALEMDTLRVPLGPVLTHWPAGLVMHAELHGDVVGDVRVTWLGHEGPTASVVERTVRVLDAAAAVLALAGDERRVRRVRGLRRRAADDAAGSRAQIRSDLLRLEGLLRSRPMQASLGLPAQVLADQLAVAAHDHAERAQHRGQRPMTDAELREAVLGRDVGEVRMLVAALSSQLWLEAPVAASPATPGARDSASRAACSGQED